MFEPRIQALLELLTAAHPLEIRIHRVRMVSGVALPKRYRASSSHGSVGVTFQEAASLVRYGATDDDAVVTN